MTKIKLLVVVLALLGSGCRTEVRNGNEVYSCKVIPELGNQEICVDSGMRLVWR
jgi:hypothetical protein